MPIPSPNKDEDRGSFIGRCMGDPVMVSEYEDIDQRAAICNSAWKDRATNTKGGSMATLTEEIFAVGVWNGIDFSIEDLNLIASAFHSLGDNHQVPLKLGHNSEQPLTDGQPALGWVTDVFVQGSKLMATFEDVPDIVAKAIEKKLYKNKSVELDMGVEHKGDYYFWVLSGVALLGADIPAVNTLNDLGALMSKSTDALHFKKRVAFTLATNSEQDRSHNMADPNIAQELETLKLQFAALKTNHDKLIETNRMLETKLAEQKVEFKVLSDAEAHRKGLQERSDLEAKLDQMVKEQQIAPFDRDDYMRDYDEATDKNTVIFAVDRLKKSIEKNPAYFGVRQAREKADRERSEAEKDASQIVTDRTNEYMAKNGIKSFAVAKTAVLKADPALAERYTKGEG